MEKEVMPVFKKFKGYLKENNLTYKDVAKLIKSSATSVSRKVSGKTQWNWSELVLIKNNVIKDEELFLTIFFDTNVT